MANSYEYAELKIESQSTAVPRPMGFHVRVDGKTVALLSFETVKAACDEYRKMDEKWNLWRSE